MGATGENDFLSADGPLMPVRKGQAPPDLRYFEQTRGLKVRRRSSDCCPIAMLQWN
jgi:hypothetical protein